MSEKKQDVMLSARASRDPFTLLRQMTHEFDHVFDQPFGFGFRWPLLRSVKLPEAVNWAPEIDVFERGNRLVTKVDLPGLKKEDVKVEVAEGQLVISGERKNEVEEKKDNVYRCERSYGSFYRAVPLPEGVSLKDVTATFANGVLEVTMPMPANAEAEPRKVPIQEPTQAAKSAAA